jgi:hypothetical protein
MVASSLQIDVSQLNIIAEPTNEINMGSSGIYHKNYSLFIRRTNTD